jgi:hypothetical protein
METPAINMVEIVDLSPSDALLPIMECVSNSVISLSQSGLPVGQRTIDVEIGRGEPLQGQLFGDVKPIKNVIVTDNGIGFNDKNLKSFETPHSNILRKEYGCLGVGRFAVLAAFQKMKIRSNFPVNGHWKYREIDFDTTNEVRRIADKDSNEKVSQTIVEIQGFYNEALLDKTAVSVEVIARAIMEHFLIFHLSGTLPNITVHESGGEPHSVNELYKDLSQHNERSFSVLDEDFKVYITRNPKATSRKNHYVHYCADSRVVGRGKRLSNLDSIFNYPLLNQHAESFLDVFVVSKFLDEKKTPTRNAFRIPATQEDRAYENEITFQDIGLELVKILRDEYSEHVKQTQERDQQDWKNYISDNPRFNSLLTDEDVLQSLPANTPDDKKEEELHRIIYKRQRTVETTIQEFISTKQVNENSIQEIVKEIHSKAVLDRDTLADYMVRRKAVIDLFDKFLEADKAGEYNLESDIHNLIFPMGGTGSDTDYEAHNLWLLDERFVSFRFIGSDKQIRTYSTIDSQKESDVVLYNTFDNPIGYGDSAHGDISSLVIFEFKRPGEVAGEKRKDFHWEFSELTDKYFSDFRYGKRQHKGKPVNVRQTTRKFGYIILSDIPEALETYNREHGWEKTPFDTFYKMTPNANMHLEAMKFDTLIRAARQRHNPFFDRLFVANRHPTQLASPASSTRGL